jgi:hypothetical protein
VPKADEAEKAFRRMTKGERAAIKPYEEAKKETAV